MLLHINKNIHWKLWLCSYIIFMFVKVYVICRIFTELSAKPLMSILYSYKLCSDIKLNYLNFRLRNDDVSYLLASLLSILFTLLFTKKKNYKNLANYIPYEFNIIMAYRISNNPWVTKCTKLYPSDYIWSKNYIPVHVHIFKILLFYMIVYLTDFNHL